MENKWVSKEQQMPEPDIDIEFKNFGMQDHAIMKGWSDGISQFFHALGDGSFCYERKAYLWRYIQPERLSEKTSKDDAIV